MKKYMPRLLAAILAFFFGTVSIYFFARNKVKSPSPYTVI
jgi:hypothetical protein